MIESSRDAEGEPFEFVTGIGEQIGDKHDRPQHHIPDDQQTDDHQHDNPGQAK